MKWQIEFLLLAASITCFLGLFRMLLAMYAWNWYTERANEITRIEPWDCDRFHEIQGRHRPWSIKINDWLEEHHV